MSSEQGGSTDPLIPIVILNWNGEADTLACLRSIRASDPARFVPVLVDNGSKPESIQRLKAAAAELFPRMLSLVAGDVSSTDAARLAVDEQTLVFIENGENLGFAKGSNVGVRFAERLGVDWVLLLNNDTEVAPDTFRVLRSALADHPEFVAVTPQIRHYEPADRVQNCGGRLTWLGSRKYHFQDQAASRVPATDCSVISCITGCALLFNHRITGALTEDFFFGEEDYEFSLRLQRRGLKMACVHRAIIRHKGGATINRSSAGLGSILVYYANRLTNVRNHYAPLRWQLTRAAAYLYLPVLLWRNGIAPTKAIDMIRRLERHLRGHRGVGRVEFQAMIWAK